MGYFDQTAEQQKARKHTGPGWDRELVQPFLDLVCRIDPNVVISQIKEKFGTLNIYHCGPDWCDKLADLFELASEQCCEECGKWDGHYYDREPGTLGTPARVFTSPGSTGWIKTLCVPCHDKRNAEREAQNAKWEADRLERERLKTESGDVV